jgi:hypothetical protein
MNGYPIWACSQITLGNVQETRAGIGGSGLPKEDPKADFRLRAEKKKVVLCGLEATERAVIEKDQHQ